MTEKIFLALSFFPARSSRDRRWWRWRRRGRWRSTGGRTRRWGREMGSGSRCGGCRTRDLSRWSWGRTTELRWKVLFFNATSHKRRTYFNVSRHGWQDYALPYFVSYLLMSRPGFELTSFHLHLHTKDRCYGAIAYQLQKMIIAPKMSFNKNQKIKNQIASKTSSWAKVVSGTELGWTPIYCYSVLKVALGCISFFCKREETVAEGG